MFPFDSGEKRTHVLDLSESTSTTMQNYSITSKKFVIQKFTLKVQKYYQHNVLKVSK